MGATIRRVPASVSREIECGPNATSGSFRGFSGIGYLLRVMDDFPLDALYYGCYIQVKILHYKRFRIKRKVCHDRAVPVDWLKTI